MDRRHRKCSPSLIFTMQRARTITFVFAVLTAVYLYAFPSATIPYLAIVLGACCRRICSCSSVARDAPSFGRLDRSGPRSSTWIVLTWTGASRPFANLLYCAYRRLGSGVIILLASRTRRPVFSFAVFTVTALALGGSAWEIREVRWRMPIASGIRRCHRHLRRPKATARKACSSQVPRKRPMAGKIPAKFFMDSQACQRCHPRHLRTVEQLGTSFFVIQ